MDLFQHLSTFVRIADAGSISNAARSLGLSVAMTSRHLAALEAELGIELIRRTTRHTALTLAGEELLIRARKLLADVDETRAALRPESGASGLIVMSVPISLGLLQIAPLFSEFLFVHPHVKVDMRYEDRAVDLLMEGVDIAIRAGLPPPNSPFIIARKLATYTRVLCASPAFLDKHAEIKTTEDLANVACIIQGTGTMRFPFETPEGPKSIAVDGRFRTNTMLAIRDAAIAGHGIAMLPGWVVTTELRNGGLVQVLPDIKLPRVEVQGLFHQSARGSRTIKLVLDYFAQELPSRIARVL